MSGMDWMPTYLAAAGNANIKKDLLAGYKGFKVHLDGYNFLPFLTGKEKKGPREELFYFSDDGGQRWRGWFPCSQGQEDYTSGYLS